MKNKYGISSMQISVLFENTGAVSDGSLGDCRYKVCGNSGKFC